MKTKDTELAEYIELMRKETLVLRRRVERRDPRYTEALQEKFGKDYRDAQTIKLAALEWAVECMEWRFKSSKDTKDC